MPAIITVPDRSAGSDSLWEESRRIYNGFPLAHDQPEITGAQMRHLESLLRKHELQNYLGYHLVHRHHVLPERTISVGTYNNDPVATCWIKPTAFEALPHRIHGNSFLLTRHGFHPYDFVQGDHHFDVSRISPTFLSELAALLKQEGLEGVVALQIVHDHPDMVELELVGAGTIMIDSSVIAETPGLTQNTGWRFDGVRSCSQYESHRKSEQGHAIFNAGSPLNAYEIVHKLKGQGILSF